MTDDMTELTVRVTQPSLAWAIRHINDFIAAEPVNTQPLAHEFVTALSNPVRQQRVRNENQ